VSVQLRLGFTSQAAAFTMELSLDGLWVIGDINGVLPSVAASHLNQLGIPASLYGLNVKFPISHLHQASQLSQPVTVEIGESIRSLWTLVTATPDRESPAILTVDRGTEFTLNWVKKGLTYSEPLPASSAPAFLLLEIPFVASEEAYEALRARSNLPVLVGKAIANHDGYIELKSSKPQLAAASPIRGLFRVDPTTFGTALAFEQDVRSAAGVAWLGGREELAPHKLHPTAVPLSDHAKEELTLFAQQISETRARVIAWGSGHGRRFFALTAAYSLGKTPLVVVCDPSKIWLWQRHAQLVGLGSGTSDLAPVRIVTYSQVRAQLLSGVEGIIFDELSCALARYPQLQEELGSLPDRPLKLAVTENLPKSLTEQQALMACVRPEEFNTDTPIHARYVPPAEENFREHVSCYLSNRDSQTRIEGEFKTSDVVTVDIPRELSARQDEILASNQPDAVKLTMLAELTSAGTAEILSPKIAKAVEEVRKRAGNGPVGVVTGFESTARLLNLLLPEFKLVNTRTPGQQDHLVTNHSVILFDRELPFLTNFESVVFVDYPWSGAVIDDAVGSAAVKSGTKSVTIIHMDGSLDDRIAVFAARRRDSRASASHSAPPTVQEMRQLLRN